jgi:hypothetical protein
MRKKNERIWRDEGRKMTCEKTQREKPRREEKEKRERYNHVQSVEKEKGGV